MFYYDSTYILVIIAFGMSMFASFGVNATFAKFNKVKSTRAMTGKDAARYILDSNGLQNVRIEHIQGNLSDHFDPRENVIRLSDATYQNDSIAAIGVAAHEAGHAVQYATGYSPIKIRNSMVPVVNISSKLSMPLFILGLILGSYNMAFLGVILFSAALLFQLVTLPVEFNASRRAVKILESSNILVDEETNGAKKVLRAAALTYVAAVVSTALQLLRLLLIANSRRRD